MKLIKLLYLSDREALLRWGRPITTDCYVSMDRGPVLSQVYNLIAEDITPGAESAWRKFISPPTSQYEVSLLTAVVPSDELSVAEERLLEEIYAAHGKKSRWELVDFVHTLPEWTNPHGSMIPIEYRDILKAANRTEAEIAAIESELEDLALIEMLSTPKTA